MSHFKGPDVLTAFPDLRPDTSVLELLVEKLRNNGEKLAMIEGQTGKTATFKDLLQNVTSISVGLRSRGMGSGDYVIFCCDKSIASYSALMGVMLTGATAILYPTPHIDIVPKLTRGFPIKAVFCDPHYLHPLETSLRQLNPQPSLVVTMSPTDKIFTSLMETEGELEVFQVPDVLTHIPCIFFSSGTTGIPKGIKMKDILIQMCGHYFNFGMERFLLPSPIFWLSALITLMSSIFNQYTVVWTNYTQPKENLHLLEKYKADGWLTGTGTMTKYINEPTLKNYNLDFIKIVLVGGEYIVKSIYDDFINKVLGGRPIAMNGFASTEAGLMATMRPGQITVKFELGCCGELYPGIEAKITDESGKIVPVGSLGELWIKSRAQTAGYWGRPDVDRESFDKDGFLRTSDAAFFDSKRQLHLRGRVGDLITFRGTKLPNQCKSKYLYESILQISPAEVEDVIMSHPVVLDSAVVGKPHPTDTQHMTAYVVKVPGTHVTEQELVELVNSRLEDKYKLRGGVHFLDALPRTIIGKVQRNLLRDM